MRKIAAILVADIVGYSRLAGADEHRTLSRLRGLRSDLIDPAIAAHHGRIVKRTGYGSLSSFAAWSTPCVARSRDGLPRTRRGLRCDHVDQKPWRPPRLRWKIMSPDADEEDDDDA
jgi:adenylate cyclase